MAEVEVQTAQLPSSISEGAQSEPAGSGQSEPAGGGGQSEPAGGGGQSEPAGIVQSEPAGIVQSEPAGIVQSEPAGSVQSEPAGSVESEPAGSVESEPAGSVESEPAGSVESEPAGSVESEPAGSVESEPAGSAESEPAGGAESEPAGGAESEPAGSVESEPAGGAESEPAGSVQSEPAVGAQSQPAAQQKQQPPLCRFFSQGRYCHFGRRCRFLHQRPEGKTYVRNTRPGQKSEATNANEGAEVSAPHSKNEVRNEVKSAPSRNFINSANRRPQNRRLCRYFASGYCSMEAYCRFWHPEKVPPVRDDHTANKKPSPIEKVERPPTVPEVIRAASVTPESATQLRKTEIAQLLKRFPKDKVIIQEREDGKVTYYRIAIVPTDPDWPFDLKEMEILLEFPEDYPLEVFTIQIPEDQDLPSVMGRHVCDSSKAWLQGKHATNQLIDKVELLFRPFLHWLDRNLERLFTEGARLLKRDIEAEKAGLEFVPYQQLQAAVAEKSSEEVNGGDDEAELEEDSEDDDSDSWTSCDDDDDDDEDPEPGAACDGMKSVEGGGGPGPRKGTEIRFLGLKLGEGVGTLTAHGIVVSLLCSRCNVTADLSLTGKQPCAAQCEKCNGRIAGTFLPSILHQYSSVMGYVDIQGAAAKDLVLPECTFLVGCLNCSHEEPVQNLSFGVTKDLNCLNCHSKLSISAEAVRFQKVQRYPNKAVGNKGQHGYGRKKLRDPAIQSGRPLPDHGTCKHYRKSCRWFRFPCCGKAYACDACHDEAENHIMELATRMLCGYCAKEQPFNIAKPCISCGSMMNKNLQSAHWEGGRGCRSKVKMSRKDKQKYANSSKTVSRKSITKK